LPPFFLQSFQDCAGHRIVAGNRDTEGGPNTLKMRLVFAFVIGFHFCILMFCVNVFAMS